MATLAPYSAKRTAIACPIPELPPVTRTFLPLSPGIASAVGWGVESVSDMEAPLSNCPLVRAAAGALHGPPQPPEREGLRRDVARDVAAPHPPERPEAEGHRRVEVGRGGQQDRADEQRGAGCLGAPAAPA